jgi:hypothetical protein
LLQVVESLLVTLCCSIFAEPQGSAFYHLDEVDRVLKVFEYAMRPLQVRGDVQRTLSFPAFGAGQGHLRRRQHASHTSPRVTFSCVPKNSRAPHSQYSHGRPMPCSRAASEAGLKLELERSFVTCPTTSAPPSSQLKHLGSQKLNNALLLQPHSTYFDTPSHPSQYAHTYQHSKWHVNSSSEATSRCK